MPIATDIVNACYFAAVEVREPWPPLWMMELIGRALLLAWLFAVGASVGSFLNVVVHRLPSGVNLVHPGSRCPRCLSPIRLWHNIPILGWFMLRGRCHDCRLPISARYPFVEFVVAMLFLLIAWVEIFAARTSVNSALDEIVRPVLHVRDGLPFWVAYLTHVVLITTLLGAALLEYDRQRVPWRLFVPALVVALLAPLIWPEIRRVPLSAEVRLSGWQAGLADGAAGLAMGAAFGLIIGGMWQLGSRLRGWPRFAPVPLSASVGLVLGWQRVLHVIPPVLLIFVVLLALQRIARSTIVIPLGGLLILSVAPALMEIDSDIGFLLARTAQLPILFTLSVTFVIAVLAAFGGAVAPRQYFASPLLASPEELEENTSNP